MRAPETIQPNAKPGATVAAAQTDAEGRYRLENLPAGQLVIAAGPADFPKYFSTSWTGLPNTLTAPPGSVVSLPDFPIPREGTATVRGRVSPPPGAAGSRSMRVALISSGYPPETLEAAVKADGLFEFTKVPSGPYAVRLLTGPYSGFQPDFPYPTYAVFVGDRDVTGLELGGPIAVIARVTVEGGGALPLDALAVVNAAATGRTIDRQPLRADGVVPLFVPPGEYRIALSGLAAGYTVKSITSGNANLLQEPFRVSSGTAPEFQVILSPSTAPSFSIRGRVTGLPTGEIARGRISIITGAASSPVNPDGTFEVRGIPPGAREINLLRNGSSIYSGRGLMGGYSRLSTANVTVVDRDISGVELPWAPLAEISAHVTLLDRAGAVMAGLPADTIDYVEDPTSITLTNRLGKPIAGGCDDPPCDILTLPIRTDGMSGFGTQLIPPSENDVRVEGLRAGYVVKSISSGAVDLLKEPLKIDATTAAVTIRVVLQNTNGARVSGRVITSAATPLVPRQVTLRGTTGIPRPLLAPVAPDGTFEFLGVSPGGYTLLANPDGPLTAGSTTTNIVIGDRDVTGLALAGLSDVLVPSTAQFANEAAALQNVRAIIEQETMFNIPTGRYGTLPELVSAGLLNSAYTSPVSGYTLSVTATASDYTVAAIPVSAAAGRYEFYYFGGDRHVGGRYLKFSGAPGGKPGQFQFDSRGQPLSPNGIPMPRVQTCDDVTPVCFRMFPALGGPPREVSGKVTVATANGSLSSVPLNIFAGLISSVGEGHLMGVRADGSFRVEIADQPAEYRISVNNLPAGYSVKSATAGAVDLMKAPLRIGLAGTSTPSIEITLEFKDAPAR
jgi:hypothetical protein